jgi:fucose permease
MGPTLLGLAQRLDVPLSQMSYALTASSLGYLLGSYQGGRLYDRVRGHPLMVAMLVGMAAALALMPWMPALLLLLMARLLLGLCEGAMDVGGNALLLWVHGRRVGPYMNALHFAFGVGALLSPLIIARTFLWGGSLQLAYGVLALLMLPPALWLLRLPSPAHPRSGMASEGLAPARPTLILLLAAMLFLSVGAEVAMGDWIYTYAVRLGVSDRTVAAYLTAIFWGGLMAGRLLAIPLAARFRPQSLLLGDLLGCLVGVAAMLALPQVAAVVWLGTALMGLALASIFPMVIALAGRLMTVTGRIGGWFGMGASAGGMVLPWLIGQLFERIGPRVTMVVIMADLLLALGVYAALSLRTRDRTATTEVIRDR